MQTNFSYLEAIITLPTIDFLLICLSCIMIGWFLAGGADK
jgi:hypothetical protein